MLASILWAPSGSWINLFQGINELLTSLFCVWKHRHQGPGSTQSKISTIPGKEMGQVALSPRYPSTPFYSWASAPSSSFSHRNHIKHFIVGLKRWLVIAQKVTFLNVICLCAGTEDLSKKNKNSSITFQCVLGRERAACPLIVSEINCFSLLPTLKTHKAD